MDIDKLFKVKNIGCSRFYTTYSLPQVPKLPNSKKRRLPDAPTPEMLKRMRVDSDTDIGSTPQNEAGRSTEHRMTKKSSVILEEAQDENPADFAPGGDADYFAEEDEEGRFYGGGLTDEQKKIMNIFDDAGNEVVQDGVRTSSF
jgi:beta-catenin-like protein 1